MTSTMRIYAEAVGVKTQAARTWTWVPVREYAVIYTDEDGRRQRATAKFYLPCWLNKVGDSGFVGDFDLIDQDDFPIPE